MARVVRETLREEAGSVLVFLPGEGEIRRVAAALGELPRDCQLAPLYGRLPRERQQAAIAPTPVGQRKVVLATSVAETSLTIVGVRVVIDAGLARVPVFDPNAGFTHLATRRVSRDAADQRAGRAGRVEPGVCLRLWSSEESLRPVREPEIRNSDLAAVALNVAAWGSEPAWLEAPPAGPWDQARALLAELGLTDSQGRITADGRQVVDWGAHPRIGRMLLQAPATEQPMACDLAALLEVDRRGGEENDIHQLWLAWRRGGAPRPAQQALSRESARWRRRLDVGDAVVEADAGRLLAPAFPDRIGQARGARGSYQLANGRGARLPADHALANQDFLIVPDIDGRGEGRIRLAAAYSQAALEQQFANVVGWQPSLRFNPDSGRVDARETYGYRALNLAERPLAQPDPEDVRLALLDGIRRLGVEHLGWQGEAEALRLRLQHLARADGAWPNCDFASLQAELDSWLGLWLSGLKKLAELRPSLLAQALKARLTPQQAGELERLAPRALQLPGGQRVTLDYAAEDGPVLAVRMQDMYGQDTTPKVAGRPVLLHLL
ncbi:MAG: ATP-dependent helicase C-terminal domain-containing protein, partial [Candidatus Competibacterales bacterium]|nr:ATP-dependent helicase C-terminal domain-containing protein [Candidatus Competibacterales bacterium]